MRVGEVAARAGVNGGEPEARAQLLHVTNGESAGNTLRQTSLGGAVLPWQDVLHEGPVQMLPRPELLRSRAAFLSECGWGSELPILSAFERRDRLLMDALEGGCQVVLWFEHDLYDQLQLLDVLSLAHDAGVAPELVAAGPSVQRPGFRGLGELAAVELEELWPTRSAVTTDVLAAAAAAWDAFRAPEPARLAQLAQQESELPFLTAALRRLLEELPAPADGLSTTERHALGAISEGAHTPPAAFLAAQERELAPFHGDTWFFRALAALGRGPSRLVETAAGEELPAAPPLGDGPRFVRLAIALTRNGERVLRGEADRVDLLGIDRWVGGTHITAEREWRWDPEGAVLR